MNKFNLQIGNKNKHTLFAIPQSNQYQTISQCIIKPDAKIIRDEIWNNKILYVDTKTNLTFHQQPKIVNQKINPAWTMQNYSPQLIKKYSFLLKPSRFINGQDARIKKIMDDLKIAPAKVTPLFMMINSLYQYALNDLTYGKPIDGLYSYNQALTEKVTDCGGFSTLLLSLLQSVNVPARLVVGFLLNKNNIIQKVFPMLHATCYMFHDLSMHVWIEVLLPNSTWFPLDPAVEWRRSRGLSKRQGGFGIIPTDRLVVSYGQDINIKINNRKYQIDILQKPINIIVSS